MRKKFFFYTDITVINADGVIDPIFFLLTEAMKKRHVGLINEYGEKYANPYEADRLGYVNKVIFPRETRPLICRGLDMLASKRQSSPPKKRGNIPL